MDSLSWETSWRDFSRTTVCDLTLAYITDSKLWLASVCTQSHTVTVPPFNPPWAFAIHIFCGYIKTLQHHLDHCCMHGELILVMFFILWLLLCGNISPDTATRVRGLQIKLKQSVGWITPLGSPTFIDSLSSLCSSIRPGGWANIWQ